MEEATGATLAYAKENCEPPEVEKAKENSSLIEALEEGNI